MKLNFILSLAAALTFSTASAYRNIYAREAYYDDGLDLHVRDADAEYEDALYDLIQARDYVEYLQARGPGDRFSYARAGDKRKSHWVENQNAPDSEPKLSPAEKAASQRNHKHATQASFTQAGHGHGTSVKDFAH